MIQIQKKSEQFNTTIFNGRFVVNKPVASGFSTAIAPYSNLFYWSHAIALEDCEFGLHPHEGFEIMTFILEGEVTHFDTASKVWTPLGAGDFQVIQSNKGIQHQERISKGTSSFQIWFDPNFYEAIKQEPVYVDYHSRDFETLSENEIKTTTYIGGNSKVFARTPRLIIKKFAFDHQTKISLQLDNNSSYTFYVLRGSGLADNQKITKDDAIRLSNTQQLDIDFTGELFCIQTPTQLDYKPVWIP
ncbi:pirin family protein [Chryseobacterium soli]|uniref:pirin family protein n=1 Tax=Chryseobacterium soli TaxID=445961 RepID=UPI002952C9B4|nr:pirin family protein [Chryseobacterium soli]MDV7696002.1 pirin family protein [Chryseobacterium soli]